MALLLSHLGASSLGSKSSWLVLSLLFGFAGAFNPFPCPLPPVSEGAKLTTITHDGVSRSWYTYVPASVTAAQAVVPLVVDLHGLYGCVTKGVQTGTGWLSKAEEFGFILVWPMAADEPIGENGLTAGARWNAGMCDECLCENCVYVSQSATVCCRVDASAADVPSNNADDVGFLREVVAQVAAAHPVDTTRVYVTGHSSRVHDGAARPRAGQRLGRRGRVLFGRPGPGERSGGLPLDRAELRVHPAAPDGHPRQRG